MFDELFSQCIEEINRKKNKEKIRLYLLDPAAQYIKDYLKPYLIVFILVLLFILVILLRILTLLPSKIPIENL